MKTECPSPKPLESALMRITVRVSRQYIPAPATNATALGASTPGRLASLRSTNGAGCVDVQTAHPARLVALIASRANTRRSEEHTSELQSLMRISYAVFCLKKKTKKREITILHN